MPCLTLIVTHHHLVDYCLEYFHVGDIREIMRKMVAIHAYRQEDVDAAIQNNHCSQLRDYVVVLLSLIFNLHNDLLEETIDMISLCYECFGEKLWGEYFIIRGMQDEVDERYYVCE